MIAERYPQEAWIHVFTDGSATNAVTNRGAGILVHFPGGQKVSASVAVGRHCSNYRAETEALIQAASIVQASDQDCKQVVFLSDALSVPGIPKPQAPKPDQSPSTSRNYQEGCSAVDSSALWNIRQ